VQDDLVIVQDDDGSCNKCIDVGPDIIVATLVTSDMKSICVVQDVRGADASHASWV
jgi:hypothetical protein